jgi:hypothetical protein
LSTIVYNIWYTVYYDYRYKNQNLRISKN